MNTVYDKKIAEQIANELLSINAVSINTKQPFRYTSGLLAPIYTDNRLLMSHPKQWQKVIKGYIALINKLPLKFNILSGTATAAIPHTAVLSYNLKKPMVYVRSSKKKHGKKNLIEGRFKKKSRVLIIEDLISTGMSIADNVRVVRDNGGIVRDCLAITTSTLSAFNKTVASIKINLYTLTNIQTVIEVAESRNYISANQKKLVEQFLENPHAWEKVYEA